MKSAKSVAVFIIFSSILSSGLISCGGSKSGAGPKVEAGALAKPASTGNAKIDQFVDDAFGVLEEVEGMKKSLAEINATLKEINNHPVGPLEWMKEDIMRSLAKAKDATKQLDVDALIEALKGKIYRMVESAKNTKVGLDNVGEKVQSLLKVLPELPAETASMKLKAPKGLKAIKSAGGPLKALPGEIKALATEAQLVLENCNKLISSIGK